MLLIRRVLVGLLLLISRLSVTGCICRAGLIVLGRRMGFVDVLGIIGAENIANAITVITSLIDLGHLSCAIVDLAVGIGVGRCNGHCVTDGGFGFLEMTIGRRVVGGLLPGLSSVVFFQIPLPATTCPPAAFAHDHKDGGDDADAEEGEKGEGRSYSTLVAPESPR